MSGSDEVQNGALKSSDDGEVKKKKASSRTGKKEKRKGRSSSRIKGERKGSCVDSECDSTINDSTELKDSGTHKKKKERKHKDGDEGDDGEKKVSGHKKGTKKGKEKEKEKDKEGKGKEKEVNGEEESEDSQYDVSEDEDCVSESAACDGEEEGGNKKGKEKAKGEEESPKPKTGMSIEDFMGIATANIVVTKPEEEESKQAPGSKKEKKSRSTKKKEKEEAVQPVEKKSSQPIKEKKAVLQVPDDNDETSDAKKHMEMEVLAWTGSGTNQEETPNVIPKRRSKTILTLTTPKEKPGSNDRVLTDRGGRYGKEKVVIPVMDKRVGDQKIKELDALLVGSLTTLTEKTPWGQEHVFGHDKSYTSSKCGLCRAMIKQAGAFRCSKCSQTFHEECLETMKFINCLEGKKASLWQPRRSFVGEFIADHKRIVPTIDYASQIKTKRRVANVALFNDSILIMYSAGGKMKVVEMIRWECLDRDTSVTVNSLSEDTISLVSPLTEIKHQLRFKSQREKEAWFAKINATIASHDDPEEGEGTMSMTQPRSQMSQSSMRSFTSIEVKNPDYVFEVTTVVPLAEGSSKSKMNFAYHIYVTKKRKKWAILKRYEDIEELDYNLKHLFPSRKQTCRLPDKKLYTSNDISLTARRMKLLEGYLNSLNHLIGVWRIGFVKEFFRPLEGDDENLSLSDTDTEDEVEEGDVEVDEMRTSSLPPEWAPALKLFNSSAKEGIKYLENEGLIEKGDPEDIAKFLHMAEGLSKDIIGEYLGKRENDATLKAYTRRLNFSNMSIDEALRKFLNGFRLCGEAQAVDRCMEAFADQYCSFNPGEFSNPDTAYILAFALIMLNTDAHSPEVKNKMSLKAFCTNLLPVDSTLSEEYLKFLYNNITKNEIKLKDEIEGWLEKLGPRMRVWKKRWFVLMNGCLYYYKDKSEVKESKWLGFFPLENLAVRQMSDLMLEIFIPAQIAHTDQTTKTIVGEYIKTCKQTKGKGVKTGRHKNFVMKATTEAELQRWIQAIQSNLKETPLMDYIRKQAEKQMALGLAQNGEGAMLGPRSRGPSLRNMPGVVPKSSSSS